MEADGGIGVIDQAEQKEKGGGVGGMQCFLVPVAQARSRARKATSDRQSHVVVVGGGRSWSRDWIGQRKSQFNGA